MEAVISLYVNVFVKTVIEAMAFQNEKKYAYR